MAKPRFSRRLDPNARPANADINQLHPFDRTHGDGRLTLLELVGQEEIDAVVQSQSIEFVAAGDTGKGINSSQSDVADAMARDFQPENPATGPTFFLNLGDIIYGPDKKSNYANKFYRPNMSWLRPAPGVQGIILGIPGNHDGEVRDPHDEPSLAAFLENFCQPAGHHAPMAASFGAAMPNQPGPYWWLSAPFLDLIGLYSNAAEDFGVLGVDDQDTKQQDWLRETLTAIGQSRQHGTRNALVIATHHPPYNQGLADTGTGHAGSPVMLAQIDAACRSAGVWPDLFLSGHSHNYQRYMRTIETAQGSRVIPYLIAGTGGIGSQPVPPNVGRFDATGTVHYENALGSTGEHNTVFGYLRVRASKSIVQATFVQTLADHRKDFETVAIDLESGQRTAPEFS